MITKRITLPQQDSILFVNTHEIVYCQSENCYTHVYLLNGKRILVVKSLTKFHQELTPGFIRVSQSYVINRSFIEGIDKKKKAVILNNESLIPFTTTLKDLLAMMEDVQA